MKWNKTREQIEAKEFPFSSESKDLYTLKFHTHIHLCTMVTFRNKSRSCDSNSAP